MEQDEVPISTCTLSTSLCETIFFIMYSYWMTKFCINPTLDQFEIRKTFYWGFGTTLMLCINSIIFTHLQNFKHQCYVSIQAFSFFINILGTKLIARQVRTKRCIFIGYNIVFAFHKHESNCSIWITMLIAMISSIYIT